MRGRPPVYVIFGEPMRPEDGENVAEFCDRIAKEVRGLVDYTTTYRERASARTIAATLSRKLSLRGRRTGQ